MMRLSSISLPLVLGFAGIGLLAAQQPQTANSPKSVQAVSSKQTSSSASHEATSHRSRHRARHASSRKGAKRRAYRPEYKQNSVQVINGEATKNVVFHDDASETSAPKTKKTAAMKNAPQPMKVEIVNGSATDTQYFYKQDEQTETAHNQPVVVGVQSSDTHTAGGNRHPVVTSVTSSSGTDAKSASNAGEPVTRQVSPRPKRPAYEPNAH